MTEVLCHEAHAVSKADLTEKRMGNASTVKEWRVSRLHELLALMAKGVEKLLPVKWTTTGAYLAGSPHALRETTALKDLGKE